MSIQTHEYRVRWKREESRAYTTRIYQSEQAARHMALIVEGRLAEAFPEKDPTALACCDGRECPCGALTNAEAWEKRHAEFPDIVDGPYIECRAVTAWRPADTLESA